MSIHIYNTINTTGKIVDAFVGILTPHICIACGAVGAVLCGECFGSAGDTVPSRCAGCHKTAESYKTCAACRRWLRADAVWVTTSYDSLYEQLLRELKFECRRQAVAPIVAIMSQQLPALTDYDVLCPLPTAPARIRQRGFDHTLQITLELAKSSKLPMQKLLSRLSNIRQVGSSRQQRLSQLKGEFTVSKPAQVAGKRVILVDDVMTTGASIAAATTALKNAGATRVTALVYAQKL